MKPFLKWAGNKYQIVHRIKEILPPGKRLIEPFVGSGALFLNTDYQSYLLADVNADLISLYAHLQEGGQAFIDNCRAYFVPQNNTEDAFYRLRDCFNTTQNPLEKAALFVYLNKHCYNGLCRYNSKGGFNVPFGRYAKPYFPELEMQSFYAQAQRAQFIVSGFVETMEAAEPGDVVYCDPPYVPLSSTSNFSDYSSVKFRHKEQEKLAELAVTLAIKGIPVVISNHTTDFTVGAYKNAKIDVFDVQRYISCDGSNRNKVSELLALFSNSASSTI